MDVKWQNTHRISSDAHFSHAPSLSFGTFRTLMRYKQMLQSDINVNMYAKYKSSCNKRCKLSILWLTLLPGFPLSPEGPATPLSPWQHPTDTRLSHTLTEREHSATENNQCLFWLNQINVTQTYILSIDTIQANLSKVTLWHSDRH